MFKKIELAIDVGGTFTDFVLLDVEAKKTIFEKVLSNPKNPVNSIKEGIRKLKINLKDVKKITYATTLGTNTLIEKNGAKCALITTKGFRDVYDIGRMSKKEMYNEFYEKHKVLIPRRRRFEINERVNSNGEIVKKIDREEILDTINKCIKCGVESIAVCLLHSYKNPNNEKLVGEIIKRNFPEIFVSLSHEIANEYREFERTSTTIVNAYIMPPLKKHLVKVDSFLKEKGFKGAFLIMQANGNSTTYKEAIKKSICMLNSGPCAGVVGYAKKCKSRDIKYLVTGDMGGTSYDVGVVIKGKAASRNSFEVLKHPILIPSIDILAIGAGGGSIIWIDKGGALNVGPISAGADPGPACYGKGGENPTVTDTNVVLGLIDPVFFCGGEMKIYPELAVKALKKKVAIPLKQEILESARDIFKIINAKMAFAIRSVTIEKGLDPVDFVLCSYGGASSIHASSIAAEIGIRNIIVPQGCANLCAKELSGTDIRHDFTKSLPPETQLFDKTYWGVINTFFRELLKEGENILEREKILPKERLLVKSFDLRYVGQEYTFDIEDFSKAMSFKSVGALRAKFNLIHKQEYGFCLDDPIEIVNLRVAAIGKIPKTEIKFPLKEGNVKDAMKGKRNIFISSEAIEYTIFDRTKLAVGIEVKGPAIIEEETASTVILPNDIARISEFGEILINKKYK